LKEFIHEANDLREQAEAEARKSRDALTLAEEERQKALAAERESMLQTARKMELELENRRLRDMDELKSAFLSSVSHELRTPLTSIRGFVKLIYKDFYKSFRPLAQGRPEVEEKGVRICNNLAIVENESDRLTRIINDVLDLAKIESGRVEWRDKDVRPEEVVARTVLAVGGEFSRNPALALEVELAPELPLVHVDPDKLEQVLLNLLHNAAKFTDKGVVTIVARRNYAVGLEIQVRDTGIGIPGNDLERIFDKFHQVKKGDTLTGKQGGTGLGLAICRQIVEHYGGRIWVESELGHGSVFCFTLPALPG